MDLAPPLDEATRTKWEVEARSANSPPIDRHLAAAQLEAADGRASSGRDILRKVLQEDIIRSSHFDLRVRMIVAALRCGDFEMVSRMLTLTNGGELTVEFVLQDDGTQSRNQNIFICTVSAPSVLQLEMPTSAYLSPHVPFLITRCISTIPLFEQCLEVGELHLGAVALSVGDMGRTPGLAFCTNSRDHYLIPDADFLRSQGYARTREHFGRHAVPWEARKQIAFWRGATTGRPDNQALGWRSLPRIRLCELARDTRPELFDVGISLLELPANHPGRVEIPNSGLMRSSVSITEFQNYRYQIDIDGHTNAWSGLFQKLLTGSPVLKVQSPAGWRQWYYDRLVPWENFVPVSADMDDLVEKIDWLTNHDEAASRIGSAGRSLAESLGYTSEVNAGAATIGKVLRSLRMAGSTRSIVDQRGIATRPGAANAKTPDSSLNANKGGAVAETLPAFTRTVTRPSPLANKVEAALERAYAGKGKLPSGILTMDGMSGQKYRLFINNLIESLENVRYLEIGSWAGSTLCAAIYGNDVSALAIDNWSGFGGPFAQFYRNLAQYKTADAKVSFLEEDFRKINFDSVGKFNIYLFDGPHSRDDHVYGITRVQPALEKQFILVVDDWNWQHVREGTMRGIRDCRLVLEFVAEIRSSFDNSQPEPRGQYSDWHNGYFIAVASKPAALMSPPSMDRRSATRSLCLQ
jgi:hypothetical protein